MNILNKVKLKGNLNYWMKYELGSPSYLWGDVKNVTLIGDPDDEEGFTMSDYRYLSSKVLF